ncbi:MAG TPA: dTMP kinase [Polyangiales bacterium]
MREGLFIVLEGVDGAGTTTHTTRLTDALRTRTAVRETREPTAGPVGALLRHALTGRLVTPGAIMARAPGWSTMALMFAADRMDHLEAEILPMLYEGVSVICDRYYHSSVAYQSLTAGGDHDAIAWIREINRHARKPDLTLVLDVPAKVAAERRRRRGGRELFDDEELQARLCEFYAQLDRHFPAERIVHVNADAPIESVAAQLLGQVERLLLERG